MLFYMGKKNTMRQRRKSKRFSKKLTKRNRSKKGGGLFDKTPGAKTPGAKTPGAKTPGAQTPGDRIDFKQILENTLANRASPNEQRIKKSLNKKTANNEVDLGFCTGLHVHILDENKNDTGNGFYFFYNFKYTYRLYDYTESKSVVFLNKIAELLLRKNTQYSDWFFSVSKDYKNYNMFDKKEGYNGIFFAHTKEPRYFIYNSSGFQYIKEDSTNLIKYTNIFKFKNIEDVINDFDFNKVGHTERKAENLKGLDILMFTDIVPEYSIAKESLPNSVDVYNGYFVGKRKDESHNYSLTRENLEKIFPAENPLPVYDAKPASTNAAKSETVDTITETVDTIPETVDTIPDPVDTIPEPMHGSDAEKDT